jgi:hypothetical protein
LSAYRLGDLERDLEECSLSVGMLVVKTDVWEIKCSQLSRLPNTSLTFEGFAVTGQPDILLSTLPFPPPPAVSMSTAIYSHSFAPDPIRSMASNSSSAAQALAAQHQRQQEQEQVPVEEQYNTLFCRALYDYEAQDPSALSFRTDDIIEVLTQQPSGWWDGLLGEERGWFPSNYVTIISDEEAEAAFSQADFSTVDGQNPEVQPAAATDPSHAISAGTQAENEEWLESEISYKNGSQDVRRGLGQNGTQHSDFWIPEVTPDGQVSPRLGLMAKSF